VIRAGFAINGTWPMRTERGARSVGIGTNALASSIIMVCRPRGAGATTITVPQFLRELRRDLPDALRAMRQGNIAPVDLAQASIGPGMAIFSRHASVTGADGKPMHVSDALKRINEVLDEVLAEQEGDFDADTRFAIAWFETHGFDDGAFGTADTLARAKNTSVDGIAQAGIVQSGGGKVRLLRPSELPTDWDPATDARRTVWEATHHLIRVLEANGEAEAGALARRLGGDAEVARDLAYRLFAICERKNRSVDARSYNALVQSWGGVVARATEQVGGTGPMAQARLV
jgi:putative DNA methylase